MKGGKSMGIIIKPIVTEKQTQITDKKKNRVGFRVSPDANKFEIKAAVEELYQVHVERVNTINYDGKRKSRNTKSGVVVGRESAFKKAIITLKDGETIDFFSNI
jgi:large subunit ribosomal protein L23